MGRASLHIYRTFLRLANRMATRNVQLEVSKFIKDDTNVKFYAHKVDGCPTNSTRKTRLLGCWIQKRIPDSWGHYGYSEAGLAYQASAMSELIGPSLRVYPGAERLDAAGLKRVLRDNFTLNKDSDATETPRLLGEALTALRVLLEQLYMHRCSSSCTTEGVRVDAASKFSTTGNAYTGRPQNLFSYRIRITNLRSGPIQLLGREWTIKNDKGQVVVHVPHAPGNAVVGQQPIIPPAHCFEYVSGADLDTPAGLQEGRLEIAVLETGRPVRHMMVPVKPFLHLHPDLHRA